jgi:Holliday junction resolvase RusA-like endonuclease
VISIALPLPPSLNNAFVTFVVKGIVKRAKSKDYARWHDDAVKELKRSCAAVDAQRYHVEIALGINYTSDIDNRIKPILDALVKAKVISDDRYVERLDVWRDKSRTDCLVTASAFVASNLPVVTS